MRNILLIIVGYLVIQFIRRAWKFRKLVLQQRDAIIDQTRAAQKQTRHEGEINIESKNTPPQSTKDDGTYVDYEEVD
ncbi:MAG: hypothetical protein ACI9JN_000022 [Bacteroidia bacterium]